jgi:hypothetical protein
MGNKKSKKNEHPVEVSTDLTRILAGIVSQIGTLLSSTSSPVNCSINYPVIQLYTG